MNLARLVACARYTPPGRGTTTIGRFPGSRVIARCPPSQYRGSNPAPVASLDSALSGYSCGGSAGFEPASLLARVTGHRWRRRGELAGTLLRCKRNYVLRGRFAAQFILTQSRKDAKMPRRFDRTAITSCGDYPRALPAAAHDLFASSRLCVRFSDLSARPWARQLTGSQELVPHRDSGKCGRARGGAKG